jgi:hypothetical protein
LASSLDGITNHALVQLDLSFAWTATHANTALLSL